jgi:peptidoglycan hydrolase-like protein with peptidoglycan-binding domain
LHLLPDGIFGKITEEAVRAFQSENGLKVDGIVGPATLAKLGIAVAAGMKKSKRTITEIIVHCTATAEGKDYTVSVKGDINCDGLISTADFQTVQRYFKSLKHLDGAQFDAADVNDDGVITSYDYLKIKLAFQTGSRDIK